MKISHLNDRVILNICGSDAYKFLQNICTNDLSILNNHQNDSLDAREETNLAVYALMLSPTGRFLFDFFIVKYEEGFLLDTAKVTHEFLMQKLKLYKLNMDVLITKFEQYNVYYSQIFMNQYICFKDPRHINLGFRIISIDYIKDTDINIYLQDKYTNIIPDAVIDLIYDKSMPQEYGLDSLSAISYTKGCYIGQEIISRTKYQGVIRKKLYLLTSDFDLSHIMQNDEILSADKKIGIVCSVYKNYVIGLLRCEDITTTHFNISNIIVNLVP